MLSLRISSTYFNQQWLQQRLPDLLLQSVTLCKSLFCVSSYLRASPPGEEGLRLHIPNLLLPKTISISLPVLPVPVRGTAIQVVNWVRNSEVLLNLHSFVPCKYNDQLLDRLSPKYLSIHPTLLTSSSTTAILPCHHPLSPELLQHPPPRSPRLHFRLLSNLPRTLLPKSSFKNLHQTTSISP